jgi:hypothetical protein
MTASFAMTTFLFNYSIVIASREAAWRSSIGAMDCRVGFASSQ